ncbi:S49 family peptidase [Sphingomonas sp. RHCKR47]|uniref:S49 family peptidase n=1 Tax=Sphingomonas citricola TaxID=2862498 RepID=UPI001C676FBF|nr:S49 family peptidase [Sphingomonas citricola]MBW6524428.1 S49 family peptidase [Sphingomonas citricola]
MSFRSFSRAGITRRMFNTPLAVLPSTAAIVLGVVGPRFDVSQLLMHAGGEQLDIGELEARAAATRAGIDARRGADERHANLNATDVLDVHDGVAHINVRGELVAENGGGVSPSSGFTGYDAVAAAWGFAQRDPAVRGIVADIDSPGGEVTDLMELCARMMADRGNKPSRAIIRGVGASAAYAIASCCDEITVQDLGYAGSIGVITMHADFSGQLEQAGVKVTLIHAGAHKADGNPFEALPDAVRASIQTDIDHAYGRFVDHVATARGMSADAVRATEARVYRGQEAVNAGLADKVMGWADSLNEFVATVNGRAAPASTPRKAKTAARASQENPSMTILAGISALTIVGSTAHAAEIQTALVAAGAADGLVVTAVDAAPVADASAEDERGRIMALVDLCPETTVSASLTTAIESGQAAGDFAIGLAQAAKGRGGSMEQLRAGSVQPDQLPAGGKPDAKSGVKAPTGQARGAAIVARAAALGHKAVAHLAPAKG